MIFPGKDGRFNTHVIYLLIQKIPLNSQLVNFFKGINPQESEQRQ